MKTVYEIATGYDATADNVNFNIEDNTLYYIGANSGDFETAGVKKSFTISIVRYHNEADATTERSPQIFDFIVNLRDVLPTIITSNEGATTDALPYLGIGDVGDGEYKMISELPVGETLTIDFVRGNRGGGFIVIVPKEDSTGKVIGFEIEYGANTNISRMQMFDILNGSGGDSFQNTYNKTSAADFAIWQNYLKFVEYIGQRHLSSPLVDVLFDAGVATLTGTERGIVVDENTATTEVIANFASADTATWSLTGEDADDFTIGETTGELSFKYAPDYETPADADGDNQYRVIINANDGVNTETFDLLVVVKDVTD